MSCLTKKSLCFLVLSILCNSTLSDITEECKVNLNCVFVPLCFRNENTMPTSSYFKLAMILISQPINESIEFPKELVDHIQKHENKFLQYVNPEELAYQFKNDRNEFEQYNDVNPFSLDETQTSISTEEQFKLWFFCLKVSWLQQDCSSSDKQYIIGYFNYLISKLNEIDEYINEIAMSPQQFCEQYDDNKYLVCKRALYTMLSLRDFKTETEIDEMKGYNAFIYCYLNYIYDDFTKEKIFPEFYSSDNNQRKKLAESSSSSGSRINQDESIQQAQIDLMNEYYHHMYQVSTQIAEHNKNEGLKLIPTVEEYCIEASAKRTK